MTLLQARTAMLSLCFQSSLRRFAPPELSTTTGRSRSKRSKYETSNTVDALDPGFARGDFMIGAVPVFTQGLRRKLM